MPRACRSRAPTTSTTGSSSPKRTRPSPSRKPPTASTAASAIAAARSRRSSAVEDHLQKPLGLGLRSGTKPVRVPQPRHGRQMGHRRLGRLEPITQLTLYAFGSWNKSRSRTTSRSAMLPSARRDLRQFRHIDTGSVLRRRSRAAPSPPATAKRVRRNTPTASRPRHARPGRPRHHRQADRPALHLRQQPADVPRRRRPRRRVLGASRRSFGRPPRPIGWSTSMPASTSKLVGAQGDLLPAQRLQPVRQILCRRVRRRPQPVDQATAGVYGNPPFVQIGAPRTISGRSASSSKLSCPRRKRRRPRAAPFPFVDAARRET